MVNTNAKMPRFRRNVHEPLVYKQCFTQIYCSHVPPTRAWSEYEGKRVQIFFFKRKLLRLLSE